MFQRVLVPLDGSDRAERAIPVAAQIARANRGSIVLVRVVLPPFEPGKYAAPHSVVWERRAFETHRAEAASYLASTMLAHASELAGIEIDMGVASGLIAPAITSIARSQQADVIVMCSHGETGLKRWFFGSIAQEIINHSTVPALILHEHGSRLVSYPARPLRALVVLDASPLSEVALEPAAHLITALAAPALATLHLQRVLDLPSFESGWHSRTHLEKAWQDAETSLKRTAEDLLQRQTPALYKLTITTSVTASTDVMETITRQTEQAAITGQAEVDAFDLIALASHPRRGLRRLITGSLPERMLGSTHLPLLVVRPPEAISTTSSHIKIKGRRNPGIGEN